MTEIQTLLESPRYAAASAAYDAIADAHGVDWSASAPSYAETGGPICKCGRVFRTAQARGLHIAAMNRKAGEAFTAAIPA